MREGGCVVVVEQADLVEVVLAHADPVREVGVDLERGELGVAEQLGRRVDSRWRDTARRIRIPFFEDGNPSSASAGGGALHREFDSYRGNRIGQGDTVRPVCDALLRSLSARSEI